MRIFNATNLTLCIPYGRGNGILSIAPKTPSGNILGSTELINNLVRVYSPQQIAFIVSGPFEINVASNVSVASQYVVFSLDEALERFAPKEEKKPEPVEEKVEETPAEEKEPEAVEVVTEKAEVEVVKEKKPRKKKAKKNAEE